MPRHPKDLRHNAAGKMVSVLQGKPLVEVVHLGLTTDHSAVCSSFHTGHRLDVLGSPRKGFNGVTEKAVVFFLFGGSHCLYS